MRKLYWIIGLLLFGCVFSSSTSSVHAGDNVWTTNGPDGGTVAALAIDPVTPATLYVGTAGGVFKSTDGGESWDVRNTGLASLDVYALAINPVTPGTL